MFGINNSFLKLIDKLKIFLFVDMVIIFVSHDKKMVVGNIWKSGIRWYRNIPMSKRFTVSEL